MSLSGVGAAVLAFVKSNGLKAAAGLGYKAFISAGVVTLIWGAWAGYQRTGRDNAAMREQMEQLSLRQAATLRVYGLLAQREQTQTDISTGVSNALDEIKNTPIVKPSAEAGIGALDASQCLALPVPFSLPSLIAVGGGVRIDSGTRAGGS